jgi:hypothetical protein
VLLMKKLMVSPALDISRRKAIIRDLELAIAIKYPRDRASSSPNRAQTSSNSTGRNWVSVLAPAFTELEAIVTFDPLPQSIPV